MGRTEPSTGRPPAAFRKDVRSKKAKATINKVIPALLSAHQRARRGIEASELIVNPKAQAGDKHSAQPSAAAAAPPAPPPPAAAPGTGPPSEQAQGPRVTLRVADTLKVAHSLLENRTTGHCDLTNREARVGILNMASPLSPGGGFINGATSQEESLCMRTTLLPALKEEFYRLPELGAVYTPDVLVFRDEEAGDLEKRDRWFVDCVSAAMLRLPETEVDEDTGRGKYVNEKDREMVLQKMRTVMRVFQQKGQKRVVLGAWGCGAYGNPVGEIARAWRKILLGGRGAKSKKKASKETWEDIEEIVFAVKDPGLASGFQNAFGAGLTRVEEDEPEEEEGEEDPEEVRVKELQEKIQELEARIQTTRVPQIKATLEPVLAGLRSQLIRDERVETEEEKTPSQTGKAKDDFDEEMDVKGSADQQISGCEGTESEPEETK